MRRTIIALAIAGLVALVSTSNTHAKPRPSPNSVISPYDLITAVNALRASYALPAYNISSILMSTAQNQADYMAATRNVSHTGPEGSSVTDRLLAAGYPLAGQLSLGGFRSENITSGSESTTAETVVNQWSGDSIHLTTMISGDLTEIGAGVSANGGRVYFVIDCALPTTDGQPLFAGTAPVGGTSVPGVGGVIIPVVVSTPNADGDLIHEVKAGQTLWQIAISYETKIDEIKRLNNLFDNEIYPGRKLLIKQNVVLTSTLPAETATTQPLMSSTVEPTLTVVRPSPTAVGATLSQPVPISTTTIMGIVMGIIAVALLGGGLVAWLGNTRK